MLSSPVRSFQLRAEESVLKEEGYVLSCWSFLWDLRQTEDHPGVDLCKAKLTSQREGVHRSGWEQKDSRRREKMLRHKLRLCVFHYQFLLTAKSVCKKIILNTHILSYKKLKYPTHI